ncbi:hypothetical protein Patl1_20018 [Pistacia atlantica]|uniref:Uncharacterized protein n=1 Tax=Pistacia atlantica TaxID=434234 RepID=A0ACC1BJY8_9ROSI|nr:hypothetical protein Patl1_20018 [Pistacia atlantica]
MLKKSQTQKPILYPLPSKTPWWFPSSSFRSQRLKTSMLLQAYSYGPCKLKRI